MAVKLSDTVKAAGRFCKGMRHAPDLFADQLGLPRLLLPSAQEELSQKRIQGLLLATQLLIATAVLLLECSEEPL